MHPKTPWRHLIKEAHRSHRFLVEYRLKSTRRSSRSRPVPVLFRFGPSRNPHMSHLDTVRELASILTPQNEARPTVLLGAGASFSSGVPLADESVKRIARRYYAERIVGGKMLPEQVKTSEWMTWLGEQDWFVRDTARLPENFPLVIKHLLMPQAYRQKVLLDLIAPDGDIGSGYRHLAELVLRGLIGTILTTNFDICLPRALNDKRPPTWLK